MLSNGIHIGRRGVALGGGGTSLHSSLVAFWKLDESSGNRVDAVGGKTATDVNTVGSRAGIVYSTAADFIRTNSEYLSVANDADIVGGDVKIAFVVWTNWDILTAGTVLEKGPAGVSGQTSYWINYNAGRIKFGVTHDGSTVVEAAATSVTASVGVNYMIAGWHDPDANVIAVQVNNGTIHTTAHTLGIYNGATPLLIGRSVWAISGGNGYFDGMIGPLMVWRGYIPTADDLTWLYNGGAGRAL